MLQAVEDCLIDEGTFKYVLISLQHRPSGAAKLIVRGSCSCGYHDDVLRNARQEVSQLFGGDVKVSCRRIAFAGLTCKDPGLASYAACRADTWFGASSLASMCIRFAEGPEMLRLHVCLKLLPEWYDVVQVQVLGGGRMEHHPEQCVLSIFGYSSAFGQAPHNVSAAIARQWLPLHTITVSYEGY